MYMDSAKAVELVAEVIQEQQLTSFVRLLKLIGVIVVDKICN